MISSVISKAILKEDMTPMCRQFPVSQTLLTAVSLPISSTLQSWLGFVRVLPGSTASLVSVLLHI